MKKLILTLVVLFVFILNLNFVSSISGFTNLTANEDTYTYATNPDTNYGNSIDLYVEEYTGTNIRHTYLEYIINDIPDGVDIDNAELCLYVDSISSTGRDIIVYFLDKWFVENILKYNHNYTDYILYDYNVSHSFVVGDLDSYVCIDITDLVSYGYFQNNSLLDLVIVGDSSANNYIRFNSKENSNPTYLTIDYSTDYNGIGNELWCKYNALKGGTITTCNTIYSSHGCHEAFDFSGGEWIGNPDDKIPPFVAIAQIEVDEPFYWDRMEIWQRVNFDFINGVGIKNFEILVYSPDDEMWFVLLDRTTIGYEAKDGAIGGKMPYYPEIDLVHIGNRTISKVRLTVRDILATLPSHIIFGDLVFCVMGEDSTVTAKIELTKPGASCEIDDDCDCRLCEYGFCVLRRARMDCVINGTSRDDCCLSGDCSNGKCTKEGLWDSIESSKNQQFGDDVDTNNFISLFFIIGISGFLMYYGNIIGGVFALYLLSIFFVIVGWLSPFILIGIIITGLIAVVFKVMLGHGTE